MAACGAGDKNAAATLPVEPKQGASPTAEPDETDVFDIDVGDCFAPLADVAEDESDGFAHFASLNLVPCDAPNAEGEITGFRDIGGTPESAGDWPGDEALDVMANRACGYSPALTYLYPSGPSWDDGDREIVCMTLFAYDYAVGDCVSEDDDAPIVPCDDPSAIEEVTAMVDVSKEYGEGATYPGLGFFDDVLMEDCPKGDDAYLYPTVDTWAVGDRVLVCLRSLP